MGAAPFFVPDSGRETEKNRNLGNLLGRTENVTGLTADLGVCHNANGQRRQGGPKDRPYARPAGEQKRQKQGYTNAQSGGGRCHLSDAV